MYAIVIPTLAALAALAFFIVQPLYVYFRDKKGLRRYPAINLLAGITDLGFMYEAAKGFRSNKLYELHKKHPVIRLGPNSLSFAGGQAIKVRIHSFLEAFNPTQPFPVYAIAHNLQLSRTFTAMAPHATKIPSTQS